MCIRDRDFTMGELPDQLTVVSGKGEPVGQNLDRLVKNHSDGGSALRLPPLTFLKLQRHPQAAEQHHHMLQRGGMRCNTWNMSYQIKLDDLPMSRLSMIQTHPQCQEKETPNPRGWGKRTPAKILEPWETEGEVFILSDGSIMAGNVISDRPAIHPGKWHHVAISVGGDSSNMDTHMARLDVFVDGVPVLSLADEETAEWLAVDDKQFSIDQNEPIFAFASSEPEAMPGLHVRKMAFRARPPDFLQEQAKIKEESKSIICGLKLTSRSGCGQFRTT
eukprot:TRINITY_DN62282_c0_g1_i1.p1 TRINITY_DN62282_c0_g1~~TRINITY_DN62282_c0_g1_i1.p1  ORF type:complete len:288 (+),score=67.33 TRINITY_DN62282_c0_g1_i1:39-866(+)